MDDNGLRTGIWVACIEVSYKHNKEHDSKWHCRESEPPNYTFVSRGRAYDREEYHPNQEPHEETADVG